MKTKILLITTLLTLGVKGQIPTNHLIFHQTFNNHSSDVGGQNNSVQGVNLTYTTDRVGRPNSSCHFNGNSVLMNDVQTLQNYSHFFISFWFKTSGQNTMYLMNKDFLSISIQGGKINLMVDNDLVTSVDNYNDGKYHQIVIIYQSGVPGVSQSYGMYIDNKKETLSLNGIKTGISSGLQYFGSSSQNTFKFTGEIDDILIYKFLVGPNFDPNSVPDLDRIYQYNPPIFNSFTYDPNSVPNFTIKGKYLESDGGVTNIVFKGGSQNPVISVSDTVMKTNLPFTVQDGLVLIRKGFDSTYSPIPFPEDTTTEDTTTTGINEVYETIDVQIYPNPSNGTFKVSNTFKTHLQVEIMNVLGERIYITESNEDVLVEDLMNGIYFLRVNGICKKVLIE